MNKKLLWGGIATVTGILIAGALLPAILSFVCKTETTVLVHGKKFVFQSKDQMQTDLSSLAADLFDRQVTVAYGDNSITLSGEEIGAGYDCATTAQEIETTLNTRNFWERFYSCYLPKPRFDLAMALDTKRALEKLWTLGYREGNEAAYPSYVIEGEQLLITAGSGKNVVDEPKALKDLLAELEAQTGKAISLSAIEQTTEQLGIPQILELVTQEPKDAYYSEETGQIIP
ncbi:MAG: hypothetical protein II351_04285, partial [Clostridia bacterium]|nr:hypothetical protein [Clostridia bacterium]